MKFIWSALLLLLFSFPLIAQKAPVDSSNFEEGVAIGEIGGAAAKDVKSGKSSFGYSLSIEATPIAHWLEIELGVSPVYASHYRETDIDFLFKKPWTLSANLEFMLGIGPEWAHSVEYGINANSWSGEIASDFMYWPFKKRQFGFYAEPGYVYGLDKTHGQSAQISTGLLINIP